ncbi:isoprenylcysteine carboxyl methyltransferase family protein [Streptomyces fructofermentans]|uniref:isoprenylcysteine carboxyl methyltransferase family protein n=1 Tax=Streptomyces fructofermentans TaxID=152141 RepID=UPI0033E0AC0A
MIWYALLLAAVAAERVAELVVARRNERWSAARGATETGQGHYPAMVALHTALLIACPAEAWLADRPFVPILAWPMLAVLACAQALRWWCIHILGPRWNTRVIVVPDLPLVTDGPYRWRWLRHPNYVAVVAEGLALPLVHTSWITATAFTLLNAALLTVRIRCENRALAATTVSTVPAPA